MAAAVMVTGGMRVGSGLQSGSSEVTPGLTPALLASLFASWLPRGRSFHSLRPGPCSGPPCGAGPGLPAEQEHHRCPTFLPWVPFPLASGSIAQGGGGSLTGTVSSGFCTLSGREEKTRRDERRLRGE